MSQRSTNTICLTGQRIVNTSSIWYSKDYVEIVLEKKNTDTLSNYGVWSLLLKIIDWLTQLHVSHSAQRLKSLRPPVDNGSLPTPGAGRLPGRLGNQLWQHLKNIETPMVLVEGEFQLTWFLADSSLFKPGMKVSSIYTLTGRHC